MSPMTRDEILLLVLRACAERGLIPRGYSTHPSAVQHAADILARALDTQPPEPPPALPPAPAPGLHVVDSPTQVMPRYRGFQQGVAHFPVGGRR
jgi:hypothetical protein